MRELLTTLDEWSRHHPAVAMATVVRTGGSTPRPAGARLAVAPDGRMAGSVSGGCLEGAVVEEALATLRGDVAARVLHYGISDELGWEVGLACGGNVDIFVEALRWGADPVLDRLRDAVAGGTEAALVMAVDGPAAGAHLLVEPARTTGTLGDGAVDAAAVSLARGALVSGNPVLDDAAGVSVFVDPHTPPPQLVVVGAVHVAAALARLAHATGFTVTVVDPRTAFLTAERFPDADRLVARWPDDALADLDLGPRDAAVCLSHDPKFDEPTLTTLLRTPVGYIGAIGSRGTQAKRRDRLRELGFDDAAIARVHGPVGLDLGGTSPEETALAILAEVVAVRRGRSGGMLGARPAAVAGGA